MQEIGSIKELRKIKKLTCAVNYYAKILFIKKKKISHRLGVTNLLKKMHI